MFVDLWYGYVKTYIRRNFNSDEYKLGIDQIRLYFVKDLDESDISYLFVDPRGEKSTEDRKYKVYSLDTGGLVQTVALINSLFLGIACAMFGWYDRFMDNKWIVLIVLSFGLGGIILFWSLQILYVNFHSKKDKEKLEKMKKTRMKLRENSG